jgi:molybdate transport system substrate-binding protein
VIQDFLGKGLLVVLAASLGSGCSQRASEPVRISAAISTREALQEAADYFHSTTGTEIELNLGPSSDLARQIEQGTPADLFLSADSDWADYLEKKNLVAERADLLSNSLVVVVAAGSSLNFASLTDLAQANVHRLALGGPAVPVGKYARQALEKAGIWQELKERVLDGRDVRAALMYVARDEAEAGIVYATDALHEPRVRVAFRIPAEYHSPISYPLVLLKKEKITDQSRRFFNFLCSTQSKEIFRRAAFWVRVDK